MRLDAQKQNCGFTLSELMIATGIGGVVLAAIMASSIALQKTLNAIDNYFATQMQQIRIIDYLNRDVKRGLIVTTSVDLQSVTITVPSYIIQAGDPEALVNPALIGMPRTPTISNTSSGVQVNYGASTSTIAYSISGVSIQRTENGSVTMVASSTDQLVPQTTDVELANTEYTQTTVTFLPVFTTGGLAAERNGTTLFSTAYLRNKRRG
jgi:prepilin-type N-terminal cleavage/methylation domain-containing protein